MQSDQVKRPCTTYRFNNVWLYATHAPEATILEGYVVQIYILFIFYLYGTTPWVNNMAAHEHEKLNV